MSGEHAMLPLPYDGLQIAASCELDEAPGFPVISSKFTEFTNTGLNLPKRATA